MVYSFAAVAQNIVLKVQFSTKWWPLLTKDPPHVLTQARKWFACKISPLYVAPFSSYVAKDANATLKYYSGLHIVNITGFQQHKLHF